MGADLRLPTSDLAPLTPLAATAVLGYIFRPFSMQTPPVTLCDTREENLAMISDTVAYLKKHGREVLYDAEHFFDSYKDDPEYSLATLKAARDAGADLLVLCDTNGGSLPKFVAEATRVVISQV